MDQGISQIPFAVLHSSRIASSRRNPRQQEVTVVPFDSLTDAVGPKSLNRPVDVAIVQDLIGIVTTGKPGDCVDGLATDQLFADIAAYQKETLKSAAPDGKVDPGGRTLTSLLGTAGKSYKGPLIFIQDPLGPWHMLDRVRFVELFARQFKDPMPYNWTSAKPPGLGTVLAAIIADTAITDLRWAADMMATVQRETGTFIPVREGSRGAGKKYGSPVTFIAKDKTKHTNIYYGRGYVQLTHLENYKKAGDELGLGEALAIDPDKVLDPSIAYNIMTLGMREGWFSTAEHKLSDYLVGTKSDYFQARRIINLLDRATEIATCGQMIEGLLWLSTRACFGNSIFTGQGTPRR